MRLLIALFVLFSVEVVAPALPLREQLPAEIIKEIRIGELRYTKEYIITRELASKVGEPFREENVEEDRKRLDRLGIFSEIRIDPIKESDGIVLEITLKETFPYLPMVSISITDANGLSAGPGFRSVNLFGRAVSLSASARFGGETNFETIVEDPWFAGHHASYRVELFQKERFDEFFQFNETSTQIGLRLGSFIGQEGRIGGLFNFLSLGSDRDGITLSDSNRDNIPSLGFYVGYDSRDMWSNPRRGWWNETDLYRSGLFDGDGDFWTFDLDIRRYQPLAEKHTLALFSLTTLRSGRVGVDVPTYLEFILGGANTIRGWSFGARNGKNQFINTAEYRYTLLAPRPLSVSSFNVHFGLQFAVFGDFGQAWNESDAFRWNDFIDGYGIGLRILVPFVNMIRVDFAWGEPGKGMSFYVAIWEKAVMQRFRVR